MTYERITADDVRVGDRIARAKTRNFPRVVAINEGDVSRRFALKYVGDDLPAWMSRDPSQLERYGRDAGNIRPRRDARLWRLVEE